MTVASPRVPTAPPELQSFTFGPARSQHDDPSSAGARPDRAQSLINSWIKDADVVSPRIVGRPGFEAITTQMGTGGGRAVQAIHQYTKTDGTEKPMVVCGGELWELDMSAKTATKRIATADLTAATITLSATAQVFCVNSANKMVVSDGTNTPFDWDGTSGGGLTKLTNAPVFYGQPVVYYGKLFAIKNTDRTTLVWSEEAANNTGYEAGGYNNAWTLRQTSQEPLFALGATNSVLYVARQNSTTHIQGEVTPELSSFGTREGNEEVGTRSPGGMIVIDDQCYMATSDRRVVRLSGTEAIDVSVGARETFASWSATLASKIEVALWDAGADGLRLIMGFPETGQTDMNAYLCINPRTGETESIWRGFVATAIGTLRNANGERRFMHGAGSTPTALDEGYVYIHEVPTGTVFDDQFISATRAIAHRLTTPALGASATTELQWVRGDITFDAPTALTNVTVTISTPRGDKTLSTALSYTSASGTSKWNQAKWNQGKWAARRASERHVSFGIQNTWGRWCKLTFDHSVLNERWGMSQVVASGVAVGHRPTAY